MDTHYHYATVTHAINALREKGFTEDFNLEENCIASKPGKFTHEEFEITEVYRYEGDSDPADEATVYGIISSTGVKGVLVTGYGMSSDAMSTAILKKLTFKP